MSEQPPATKDDVKRHLERLGYEVNDAENAQAVLARREEGPDTALEVVLDASKQGRFFITMFLPTGWHVATVAAHADGHATLLLFDAPDNLRVDDLDLHDPGINHGVNP